MDSAVPGDDARDAPEPVGRAAEIIRLQTVVSGLLRRRGALVEIAGDPGIGKSALLDVLATRARAKGVAVFRARALDRPAVPYQVFRDTWTPQPVDDAHTDILDGAPDLPAPDADDDERFRFGRAVHARLARLARTRAAMLIVDDVHLCDAASAELLAQLVRTPVPGPFALALAHRPRQSAPALLDALARATPADGMVRVQLDRLDEQSFETLVAGWRRPVAAEPALYEAAEGNPQYAAILAQAGWNAQAWPESAGAAPDRLLRAAAVLVAELARLDAAAWSVALAAAVLGDRFTAEDVARVVPPPDAASEPHCSAESVLDVLARLASLDVVRPLGTGGRFAFRHPLLRHATLAKASATARRRAHERAFDLLSARNAPVTLLARHVEQTLRPGDGAAVRLLTEAAEEAITDAPSHAARWLELALDALPQQPAAGAQAGGDAGRGQLMSRDALMLRWSRALRATGRPEHARALAHQVLRRSESASVPSEAHELWVGAERDLGHYEEADAVASAAFGPVLTAKRPLPTGHLAALAVEYGKVCLLRGQYAKARALVQGTIEAAHAAGDTETEASARALSAFGHVCLGEAAAAASCLAASARLIDGLHDGAVARNLESVTLLGWGEFFTERFTDANRHLHRGLAVARATGRRHVIPLMLLGVARTVQLTGRPEDADDLVRTARRLAQSQGARDVAGLALAIDAAGRMWWRGRGETKSAVALAEEAVSVAAHGNGWWLLAGVEILAQGRLLDGDPDRCLRDLLERAGGRELPLILPALRPICHAILAEAALQAGYPRAARRWSKQATAEAEALGLPMKRMVALRARAAVLAADGHHESAARMYRRAAEGFRRAGVPIREAWTLVQGAHEAELAYGPAVAARWLDRALHIARELGAARIVDEITPMLDEPAALGAVSAHAQEVDVLSVLTQRERQVALLAGRGKRTREIATQLYVSPRTVDAHLARIYHKLNVSSRIALAGLILGPTTPGPGALGAR